MKELNVKGPLKFFAILITIFLVQGCATKANFKSIPDGAQMKIGKTDISGIAPQTGKIPRTTFGKYPVKIQKEGYDPIFSNLPLHVGPEYIILDALLFAPAAFFNVQGAFSFYEFDMERGIIKYKNKENDEWKHYQVSEDQKVAVKSYFGIQ